MLLHTTIRCSLESNPIMSLIDKGIGRFGFTNLQVATAIMSSAMEESVKVWFEEDVIAVQLPVSYVRLSTEMGDNYERIIIRCLERGLRWLEDRRQ